MPSTLITGANRGLGLEFARQYVADGWQVYATCREPESATELRRLTDVGVDKLRILQLDVSDLASVKAAAAKLVAFLSVRIRGSEGHPRVAACR